MPRSPVKMTPDKFAALLVALCEGEYNSRELADYSGLHYNTVLQYLRAMHEHKPSVVYICKWEKDALGRESLPIFKLQAVPGSMSDVPRPRVPRTEQQRRYRSRKELRMDVNAALAYGLGNRPNPYPRPHPAPSPTPLPAPLRAPVASRPWPFFNQGPDDDET